ncbi:MAG TPA: DUF4388 domain-containing protein [Planctomycetota bacterium]|nr:DUF4388 domain-containing protein [Planctomycetota bacterium]
MTLKGNLEVLNLSDIFQSLSLNQHTGTLRVTDGKREKLVHFAQGEITLLASEKKVKIGEMLVASGKISAEDLDYALQQQKKSKKRLGEILIEEGFVSEDDIAEIVKQQIEAEIYDLFLWKKADFEFLIDYIPEKLKNPSHGITKLQFNTSSLIMEALRRLDEWSLISKEISTLKEVYKVVNANPAALDDIELPERVKAEIKLIDGEKTLEAIAEETSLSEFELCKLIFELKSRGIVAPLTPQELSDHADDAFQKGKFRQAASMYERLVEVLPKNLSIRWHLADSLKSFGDEARALDQYGAIAQALEGTRDRIELAKAYRAILELAPDRKDILEKLRALDKAKWQQTAVKSGLVILLLVAVAGAALVFLGGETLRERWKQLGGLGGLFSQTNDLAAREKAATALLKQIETHDKKYEYDKSFELGIKLANEYPDTEAARKVILPVIIKSDPDGREIMIDGVKQGKTPGTFGYRIKTEPDAKVKIDVVENGRILGTKSIPWNVFQGKEGILFDLWKSPSWSSASGGAVRGAPVFNKDMVFYDSLDGHIYGKLVTEPGSAPPSFDFTGPSQGDAFGFAMSPLILLDDLVMCGTLDGEAKGWSLMNRQRAFTLPIVDGPLVPGSPPPLPAPLLAGPVVTAGGIAAFAGFGNAITFVNVKPSIPQVLGQVPVGNRVVADMVEAGGTVYAASCDNNVYAIDAASQRLLWPPFTGRGDFVASPVPVSTTGLVVGDVTGQVALLDIATGAPVWKVSIDQPVVGIAATDDALFVSTKAGLLHALSLKDGSPAAKADGTGPLKAVGLPPHPGCPIVAPSSTDPAMTVVIVGGDGALMAFDTKSLAPLWTARTKSAFRGRPALYKGKVYIGADDGYLHAFDP